MGPIPVPQQNRFKPKMDFIWKRPRKSRGPDTRAAEWFPVQRDFYKPFMGLPNWVIEVSVNSNAGNEGARAYNNTFSKYHSFKIPQHPHIFYNHIIPVERIRPKDIIVAFMSRTVKNFRNDLSREPPLDFWPVAIIQSYVWKSRLPTV